MLSGEDFGYVKDNDQHQLGSIVKKSLLVGSVLFSIACFVYITINAYYFVYSDRDSNIKVIKSPEEPIKVVDNNSPENAVKDVDKTIYDSIVNNKNLTRENLNQVKIIEKAETPIASSQARKVIVERKEPVAITVDQAKNEKTIVPAKISGGNMMVYDSNNSSKTAAAQSNNAKPSAQVFDDKKPTEKPASAGSGRARVQVAALASKSAAADYWSRLKKSYPALFSDLNYFISEVNLGAKGTFYRLQIGNFRSQVDAEEFCHKYISQVGKSKADCLIVE